MPIMVKDAIPAMVPATRRQVRALVGLNLRGIKDGEILRATSGRSIASTRITETSATGKEPRFGRLIS
jgi:hypothetical protein